VVLMDVASAAGTPASSMTQQARIDFLMSSRIVILLSFVTASRDAYSNRLDCRVPLRPSGAERFLLRRLEW
jgi:hypothetical protein